MNIWMISLLVGQGIASNTPGDLDPLNAAVVHGEKAYLLRSPEFIADNVNGYGWKDDQLVYVQSSAKNQTAMLWNGGQTFSLGEFPADAKVSLVRSGYKKSPVAVVARGATSSTVVLVGEKIWTQTFANDGFNVGAFNGGIGVSGGGRALVWFADGSQLEAPRDATYFLGGDAPVVESPKVSRYVLQGRKWVASTVPPKEAVAPPAGDVRVEVGDAKSGPETRPTWRTEVWFLSASNDDPNRVLIHADADAELSLGFQYVATRVKGSLFVRKIHSMPKDAFYEAASAAEAKEVMDKAKQVGMAMLIYSADYDDGFPIRDGWKDAVAPYAKDNSLFNGFDYSLDRKYKNSGDVENPSETEMGRMRGRYGDAIVRADGSVIWIRKKP